MLLGGIGGDPIGRAIDFLSLRWDGGNGISRPSSTAIYPTFIHRHRRLTAADRMAPPPNMKGVYFLAHIHEGVVPRSFASEVYAFNVGEESYRRGGVCLRKQHMDAITMEGWARGGYGERGVKEIRGEILTCPLMSKRI